MPEQVKRAAEVVAEGDNVSDNGGVVEDGEGRSLARSSHFREGGRFLCLGRRCWLAVGKTVDTIRERVDAVLADATGMLDRLDLAHALSDARVHSETEALRDALIGSVSHQLRTPLASILGTATVISRAPGNSGDPRLASLAEILRDEVDRLNNGVQDLLDAALISSKGVRMDCEWVELADIVNATVDRRQRLLAGHRVILDTAGELPLIYVDPILLEQALGQIVDNAAGIHSRVRRSPLPPELRVPGGAVSSGRGYRPCGRGADASVGTLLSRGTSRIERARIGSRPVDRESLCDRKWR